MSPRTISGERPWSEIPVFERVDADDLRRLDPLAILRDYERDEAIFEQGDPSDTLHFLVRGRVKIVKARPDGNELILEILGPGDPVGVIAALEGFPFPATAMVHEDCRVLSLPRREFLGFLESHPTLVRSLLAGFCRRNLQFTQRLAEFPGTVEARIARMFLTLAGQLGQEEEGGTVLPLSLTRQEIADLVGTTLETAIRVLSRWGKEGIVITGKEGFLIADEEVLRRRADLAI